MFRGATIEAERKLVQVMVKLTPRNPALVGAKGPSFQQGSDPVDSGQHHGGVLGRKILENGPLVAIAMRDERLVRMSAVGDEFGTGLNIFAYKADDVVLGVIRNSLESDPSDRLASDFRGDSDERLLSFEMRLFPRPSELSLVYFDFPGKPFAFRPHHCSAQFVQTHPSRFITTQTKQPLETERSDAALLVGDPPGSPEPSTQGQAAVLKNRANSCSTSA